MSSRVVYFLVANQDREQMITSSQAKNRVEEFLDDNITFLGNYYELDITSSEAKFGTGFSISPVFADSVRPLRLEMSLVLSKHQDIFNYIKELESKIIDPKTGKPDSLICYKYGCAKEPYLCYETIMYNLVTNDYQIPNESEIDEYLVVAVRIGS